MAIDGIREDPVGDDQKFNRDVMRTLADIIAALESLTSRVENLERRVN